MEILLQYVIKKSYEDPEAFEVLNRYDAERTGQPLEDVRYRNQMIRNGHADLALETFILKLE